jgi:hypothetical protein
MLDGFRKVVGGTSSFCAFSNWPPSTEIYTPPPPPVEPVSEPAPGAGTTLFREPPPEKPKLQPREVARKAVTEIKKTPPKLFLYSIGGAVGFILLIVALIAWHIHSENSEDDSTAPVARPAATPASPATSQAAQAANQTSTAPPAPIQVAPEPVTQAPDSVSVKPKYTANKKKLKAAPPAPAIIPGSLSINSNPEGAQIQIDGHGDSGWLTPYIATGLTPGQHAVSLSKAGYTSEARTIEVTSGSKSFLVLQLAPLTATVSVASEPAGAAVWMDGRDTGKVTPSQFVVDKPGNHTFVVKKQGYLDENTTANLQFGQTFHFGPTLKVLGTTDEIRMGGKFKKMFGGSDTAGMGTVSIKTQPKGAQVAVNNRVLDKGSPLEFYLNPGNYVIDITLSGYKSIHRVVQVDKGGKVAVDETLQHE